MSKRLIFILCIFWIILISGCSNTKNDEKHILPKDTLQEDFKEEIVESTKEENNNLFFFKNNISTIHYKAKFSYDEGYDTKVVSMQVLNISGFENGALYELKLEPTGEFPGDLSDNRLTIYLYVDKEKIYRIWNTYEEISQFTNEKDIISNSSIVCQESELSDILDENAQGIHHSIAIYENQRISNMYECNEYGNRVGYYESFSWEEGKGMVWYRSGYREGADSLELEMTEE